MQSAGMPCFGQGHHNPSPPLLHFLPAAPFPGRRLLETGECIDSPTPDTFSCEQQRAWGKCAEQWMVVVSA